MLLKEIPRGIKHFLKPFRKVLSEAQFNHFQTLTAGLIVNDKKTVQEICEALSAKDQSSMNKSIAKTSWEATNDIRIWSEPLKIRVHSTTAGQRPVEKDFYYRLRKAGGMPESGLGLHFPVCLTIAPLRYPANADTYDSCCFLPNLTR